MFSRMPWPLTHLLIMQYISRFVLPVDLLTPFTQMPALDALTVLLAQSSEARVHFRTSGMQKCGCACAYLYLNVCVNGCV